MIERNYSKYIADHADVLSRRALLDPSTPSGDKRHLAEIAPTPWLRDDRFCPEGYVPTPSIVDNSLATIDGTPSLLIAKNLCHANTRWKSTTVTWPL
jgi:hypothetical protein